MKLSIFVDAKGNEYILMTNASVDWNYLKNTYSLHDCTWKAEKNVEIDSTDLPLDILIPVPKKFVVAPTYSKASYSPKSEAPKQQAPPVKAAAYVPAKERYIPFPKTAKVEDILTGLEEVKPPTEDDNPARITQAEREIALEVKADPVVVKEPVTRKPVTARKRRVQ